MLDELHARRRQETKYGLQKLAGGENARGEVRQFPIMWLDYITVYQVNKNVTNRNNIMQ